MTITNIGMPMRLTLKNDGDIGYQITFPSPRVGVSPFMPRVVAVVQLSKHKFFLLLTLSLSSLKSFAPIIGV